MILHEKTKDILKSIGNIESFAREVLNPTLLGSTGIQINELKGEVANLLSPLGSDLVLLRFNGLFQEIRLTALRSQPALRCQDRGADAASASMMKTLREAPERKSLPSTA